MDNSIDGFESEDYDEESQFCSACTDDFGLEAKIRSEGEAGICSVCKEGADYVVSFSTLAIWVKEIWREWFHPGSEVPVLSGDTESYYYAQCGDEPELLINELIQCRTDDAKVVRALIDLLARDDQYNIMQGGDPTIDEGQSYERRKLVKSNVDERWNTLVLNLRHHTRFFNEDVAKTFDSFIEELTHLHIPPVPWPFLEDAIGAPKQIVDSYDPGSLTIFRARKLDDKTNLEAIFDSPESQLSNPPDRYAAEGRMNARGISYFYGAGDRQTCLAELRPTLSECAVTAEFELVERVQLLDLTLLSSGRYKRPESLFDENYLERRTVRELLRQLHSLIAKPVSNGDPLEYLPTQALAEYLARRVQPKIDGIIFRSVQRDQGRNFVFFPHVLNRRNHSATEASASALRLVPESLMMHRTKRIEYEFDDRNIVGDQVEFMPEDFEQNEQDLDF